MTGFRTVIDSFIALHETAESQLGDDRAYGLPAHCVTPNLAEQVHAVILATANNSSSTRQDLHARRRTELSYFLGYACRAAQSAGLSTPALDRLLLSAQDALRRHQLPAD